MALEILVATPESDLGRLLCDMLEADGHTVQGTADGRSAVQALTENLPELVLLDARLPDISALDVLRTIRQAPEGATVSIILLSHDPECVKAAATPYGVEHVFLKPFSLLEVSDFVRVIQRSRPARKGPSVRPPAEGPRPEVVRHGSVPRYTPDPEATRLTLPPPPPRPAEAPRAPPPSSARIAAEVAHTLIRLRREVDAVEKGDAWTALGVPHGSEPDLVRRAAIRMEGRYAPLAHDGNAEIRDLAERMLAQVRLAVTHTGTDTHTPPADDGLAEGRALLAASEWRKADAWFEAARDRSPDSAACLACLGWARLNNPGLPKQAREEDGVALLRLSVQFDPRLIDAHLWLATFLRAQGDTKSALAHVQRVLRLDPGHAEAGAMSAGLTANGPA